MNLPTVSLDAKNVCVTYPNGHNALYDVSFSLSGGHVCALIGMNGSGKSTLFNSIMGVIRPQTGQILLNAMPTTQALKVNSVAYVPQADNIDWHFPIIVQDVVMQGRYGHMGFLRRAKEQDKQICMSAMQRLGIEALANRQIGELSGGQKKRVFLARALAQESRLLLLDEPFTGVDMQTEQAIMALLQELSSAGYLILVSTHNLGSVPQYCDKVIMLNKTIIAKGEMTSAYTRENLERTFGGTLHHLSLGDAYVA